MHFLHVPVTTDGRLHANSIYTRASLRRLQTDLPAYLQSKGFTIERGVEQVQGSAKKHLNTREYKQQQEELKRLQEQVKIYEAQAREAEEILDKDLDGATVPEASFFSYKSTIEKAKQIIALYKKALPVKKNQEEQIARLEEETKILHQQKQDVEASKQRLYKNAVAKVQALEKRISILLDRTNKLKPFLERPETLALHAQFQAEQERLAKEEAARLEQGEEARRAQEEAKLQVLQASQSQQRPTFRMR